MPGWFSWPWGGNRVSSRDVSGIAIGGDVSGQVIQYIGGAAIPNEPRLPWDEIPTTARPDGNLAIFALLTWRARLTRELVGRDADRDKLLAWARDDPRPIAIRLLTGPGGAGKSRLAAEIATLLRGDKWTTGLVTLDKTARLPLGNRGVLVVIDYPEANRTAVRRLLEAAALLEQPPRGSKIRLLLVSRQPLAWWEEDIIAAGAAGRCDAQDSVVGPLDAAATCTLVRAAAGRLAKLPGTTATVLDDGTITAWHARNPALHGLPLFATAAAVHAMLDEAPTFALAGEQIITALVSRERMRLERAGETAGWGHGAASRLHGLAAVRDGLDADAVQLLAAPDLQIGLPDPNKIVNELPRLGWWAGNRVPAPVPDIVSAELLYQILVERRDRAAKWLAAALADPLALDVDRLGRLAHDMATLHGPATETFCEVLIEAVTGDPPLATAWEQIAESSDLSFRLAGLAAQIGQSLLMLPGLAEDRRARLLNNLSVHLGDAGDNAGALAASREAVHIWRRLAAARPARFEPDLAGSLNNLSIRLSAAGDNAGALAASRETVLIRRRLAAANPARFEPNLARSLNNLSNRLSDAGDNAAALAAIREAADIYRRLAAANPARFEPDLASSLNNLSSRLSDVGDNAAARAASREAVDTNRRLAAANPARFEPNLALSLNNLSVDLSDAGDNVAALAASREAVDTYRRLTAASPARFEPDLAGGLNNLSIQLSGVSDNAAALAAIREAVVIRRRLAAANPARFEPDLARSLNNLSNRLSDAGDNAAARAASREAANTYRRLATANPARFEPDLATSLNNLSGRLGDAGDNAAALAAIRKAVDIRRRLAAANPARFKAELLGSLRWHEELERRFSGPATSD